MVEQTSSIVPALPIGFVSASLFIILWFSHSVKPATLYRFVSRKELETQLILTPKRANSIAADLVIISSPAFDMQYEIRPGYGFVPLIQEIFIIEPWEAINIS